MTKRRYPVPGETADRQARASDPAEFGLGVGQCRLGQDACAVAARHPAAARGHRPVEDPVPDLYARRRRQHVEPRLLQPVGLDDARRRAIWHGESRARRPSADADKLRRARRLFAEALETPGGLKIQTIHAFCESVLHQFPLEANIAAHFEMLDPQMEEPLFAEARREMMTGAVAAKPGLAEAFADDPGARRRVRARPAAAGDRGQARRAARVHRQAGRRHGELWRAVRGVRLCARRDGRDDRRAVWPLPGFPPDIFERFHQAAILSNAKTVLKNILPALDHAFREPIRCGA